MVFFAVAFFWLVGLFAVGGVAWIIALFAIYRLTGGKRSFWAWFKAMRF